jgi:hypothetical protein
LKNHARSRESGAGQCAGEHPRHARDEENLRVDVFCERNRAIEDAREADRRAADERRKHARSDGKRAEPRDG